jgi:hypothetical protein
MLKKGENDSARGSWSTEQFPNRKLWTIKQNKQIVILTFLKGTQGISLLEEIREKMRQLV